MKRIITIFSALLMAVSVFAQTPQSYTSFQGDPLSLYAWQGNKIMLLSSSNTLDPTTMNNWVLKMDAAYNYYALCTGREPSFNPGVTYINNRSTMAEVPATCGAGCGYLGASGIEMLPAYFTNMYNYIRTENLYDQIAFYELGRNFWFYSPKLQYKSNDPVVTGYAVFMRFMSMEAANVQGAPFNAWSFSEFKNRVKGLLPSYMANPSLNWSNTLGVGQGVPNSSLGASDLFASFCFYLRDNYCTDNHWVENVWKFAALRPDAVTTQDAVDNFVIASSQAANANLANLFISWRWPVSNNAISFLNSLNLGAISSQPSNTTATEGSNVQFTVNSPSANAYFQWQMDSGAGFQNISNGGQFSGVNTNTLTVSNVTSLNNNHSFRCIVRVGSCPETSNVAVLQVNTFTDNPVSCNDYIEQLSNGNIKFSATFSVARAYIEVFATKNGQQHLATNIVGSQVANANGTFTYSYTMPASYYLTGDKIQARFYSYAAGGAGVFTPGESSGVWSEAFFYNVTECGNDDVNPPVTCDDYIQQLSNGDIKLLVSFPIQQAYVEVFARKNGQQNIATNIVGSQVVNSNGTYSYSLIVPASTYKSGDVIVARFYSYAAGSPGVFTPGPSSGEWTESFIYNQTASCQACVDIYEDNQIWQNAASIPFNTTVFAKIDTQTDRDWFTFTTTSAAPYFQVSLKNLDTDLDISLYDAGFTFVMSSQNAGTQDELITYNGAGANTYYMYVYGYNNRFSDQCYHLKVTTSTTPFNVREGSFSTEEKDGSIEGTLSFYPNPAQVGGELIVETNVLEENTEKLVRIIDMKGSVVLEQNVSMSAGKGSISLAGIKSGIYVVDLGGLNKQKLVIE
jgi:hypothetical protein